MANKRIKINSRTRIKIEAPSSKATSYARLQRQFAKIQGYVRRKKSWMLLSPIAVIILFASLWGISQKNKTSNTESNEKTTIWAGESTAQPKASDVIAYDFKKNDDFFDALKHLRLGRKSIPNIIEQVKDQVPTKDLEGATLRLYSNPYGANYLIFEPEDRTYNLRITLADIIAVVKTEKKKESIQEKRAHLVDRNNIYNSLARGDFHPFFIEDLFDLLAWNTDISRITKANNFKLKVIFNNYLSDGIVDIITDSIRIQAIQLEDKGEKLEFYRFTDNRFYDEQGKSARKKFLKAPIDYKRISSKFGPRIHPIDGFHKVHRGTDFAAPESTHIRSLADGVVTVVGSTENNGNYIKIKHDDVYESQYLHLKDWAEGMTKGKRIKQGELIGFVGSTGKSNGPHVCLRFWKNGSQIDFLNEQIPSAFHLDPVYLDEFNLFRDSLKIQLQKIPYL